MSSKRPAVDLMALTAEQATPMPEAVQRTASKPSAAPKPPPAAKPEEGAPRREHVATANLEALAFKVPPSFRKRFRSRAAEADLKLNELLFAAFDAWEAQQGFNK
jgi:hypothetical protein